MKSLEKLMKIASDPESAAIAWRQRTKKGIVGCFPVYTPEPLVHAAGLLPMGLWGGNARISRASSTLPVFVCSVMQEVIELEMSGKYEHIGGSGSEDAFSLDAVIIPSLCDTLKSIGQKWKVLGDIPAIQFTHPQNRELPSAVEFLAGEYEYVKTRLEAIVGEKISDDAIFESLEIYNEHNAVMRRFSGEAAKHPDIIGPVERHAVMKSAWFIRKEEHTALVRELIEELKNQDSQDEHNKYRKVVLSGIMAEPDELLKIMEDCKLCIAADDLAQESRQYRVDYDLGRHGGAGENAGVRNPADPLRIMALAWQDMYGCSLATDPKKRRVGMLSDMVRESGADGLIVCMMKFCDPEAFDYPLIKDRMQKDKIPHLMIDIDQQATGFEQLHTRLQAFSEML